MGINQIGPLKYDKIYRSWFSLHFFLVDKQKLCFNLLFLTQMQCLYHSLTNVPHKTFAEMIWKLYLHCLYPCNLLLCDCWHIITFLCALLPPSVNQQNNVKLAARILIA